MRDLKAEAAGASGTRGAIKIVRAGELAKEGRTGVVAQGRLEKVQPNKFNASVNDFYLRDNDDTLYIINGTRALQEQLGQDGVTGLYVTVTYNGKLKTKNGKGFHDFSCTAE